MACGCSGGNKVTAYIYVDHEGNSREFPTEIEAKAAKVRNGNRGLVRAK